MQCVNDGATRRYSKAAKARHIILPLILSLMLAACGGGGSDGATGGFADPSFDKSPSSLEAVTLTPISGIPSSAPSTTPSSTPAPGVPLVPITGIPSTDPGVSWGPVLRTFGDPSFKLNGPAGISEPLVFSSSNTGVATISGSTVTIVGAGASTITASKADKAAASLVGATITLTVKKAQPNLSMPTVTLPALWATVQLQASTRSPGAVKYALSNMMSSRGQPVGQIDSDGRTFSSFAAGTALITATQVPTANYEGGTVSGQLVVEKRKFEIPLNDLIQPFTSVLHIPVEASLVDEVSGESRAPTVTVSNPAMTAAWDESLGEIRLVASKTGSTYLTFSLGATANLAPVGKTVSVTLTEVTEKQPGRQLTGVKGHTPYTEDYVFDAEKKAVTLKLCPSLGEKVDFSFTESDANRGNAHVTLNGGEVTRDALTGSYVANIQAIATADAPLKLRSFVDAYVDGSGVNLAPSSVFEYDVKVELIQNPIDYKKCYQAGGH